MEMQARRNAKMWLFADYDIDTQQQVKALLEASDNRPLVDAFCSTLEFGTGGMRGLDGVGTNRMNRYTIRTATQGVAQVIAKYNPASQEPPRVFIGYDTRLHSLLFAQEAARVLAANGIQALLCTAPRPTPFVSFSCRYFSCSAALMITASHNPAVYNGYKVYWSDGGQVLPPYDIDIVAAVAAIADPSQVQVAPLDHPLIVQVGADADVAYLQALQSLQLFPEENKKHGSELAVVYSSLHGTGIT